MVYSVLTIGGCIWIIETRNFRKQCRIDCMGPDATVEMGVAGGYMGLHAFVYKMAPSRITRHHALNDIISRAFASAKIPVTKEPSGLFRSDGKRPDGLMLIPWQRGLSPTWDVTVARWQTPQLAPQLKWRLPENKPSTPHCQGRTCSNRLLCKLWAQSTNRLCNS